MMSVPFVKMCGIMRFEDAERCLEAGADYLGVIRVVGTPRYKDARFLKQVVDLSRHQKKRTCGVYKDAPLFTIVNDINEAGVQHIQLHGDETPEYCDALVNLSPTPLTLWKVFDVCYPPDEQALARFAPYLSAVLLDLPKDFKGAFHWGDQDLREFRLRCEHLTLSLVLAGKLTANNVESLVDRHQPDGVDVASGIEGVMGLKDSEKVDAFMNALRA